MSEYEIPYTNLIIRTFAERFQMTRQDAYAYLREHPMPNDNEVAEDVTQ